MFIYVTSAPKFSAILIESVHWKNASLRKSQCRVMMTGHFPLGAKGLKESRA
jgi:hypothetical protein